MHNIIRFKESKNYKNKQFSFKLAWAALSQFINSMCFYFMPIEVKSAQFLVSFSLYLQVLNFFRFSIDLDKSRELEIGIFWRDWRSLCAVKFLRLEEFIDDIRHGMALQLEPQGLLFAEVRLFRVLPSLLWCLISLPRSCI